MKTPFVLVDNVFDRINLYPLASLRADAGYIAGREPQYVADYRRERTYFQTGAVANAQILADLGVGNSAAIDTVWIDRGHNLWGRTIRIDGSPDGHTIITSDPVLGDLVVPAQGTVGGDPTTGWCVTEEGALYTLFNNAVARRSWRVVDIVGTPYAATIPGLIVGKRIQLLGYSSVVDEDAGERTERSEASLIAGYAGSDRTYSARKLELKLSLIGAAEYDSSIRKLRRLLFDINQPALVCMNYGTKPERAWLYKYHGNQWSSPTSRSHRSASIPLYEYGPLIR